MFSDTYKSLPPLSATCGIGSNTNCYTPGTTPFGSHTNTLFMFLLPFVDQPALSTIVTNNAASTSPANFGNVSGSIVKPYLCPSDISAPGGGLQSTLDGMNGSAVTNYAGNNFVFGDAINNSPFPAKKRSLDIACVNGLSNSVFYTEVLGTCGSGTIASATGNVWSDAGNSTTDASFRPGFNLGSGKLGTNVTNNGTIIGGALSPPQFGIAPSWLTQCVSTSVQGLHTGGIQVAMGDGSAKFVSQYVSVTGSWANAINTITPGGIVGDDF